MGKFIDRSGQRYGRLVVGVKTDKRNSSGNVLWMCHCDCGRSIEVPGSSLQQKTTQSCGCLFLDVAAQKGRNKKRHGMTKTRAYNAWVNMKTRCLNPAYKRYATWGGRGISVASEWMVFENFYKDMGDPPIGYSLDRIDVNGNYCKSNCRWATQLQQQNNRRNNIVR